VTDSNLNARVLQLLETSLSVWGVEGRVEPIEGVVKDDTMWIARIITTGGTVAIVGRMTVGDGERQWRIVRHIPGEGDEEAARRHWSRTHSSVSGLLRGVRRALDAPLTPGRLILTPRSVLG
jgi:hypothetical protein